MNTKLLKSVTNYLLNSVHTKYLLLSESAAIAQIGEVVINALKRGNKVVLMGNGGSAADAQHIAAELAQRIHPTPRQAPEAPRPRSGPRIGM